MPAEAEHGAEDEPEAVSASARARACTVESANVGSRNVSSHVVVVGISTMPPTIASTASDAHRDLHRQRALGDVVLGAGEADVGVLDLAVGRVDRLLGVVEVAVLELARLGHGLAPEGAEDHPPRVDRGQERADVAGDVEHPVPAAPPRR